MQDGPKDFLKQVIQVGDTIVYPNRQSSSLWMNKAQVVGMKKIADGDPDARHEPLQHDQYSIRVKRAADGLTKTLTCLERVVVLTGKLRTATVEQLAAGTDDEGYLSR